MMANRRFQVWKAQGVSSSRKHRMKMYDDDDDVDDRWMEERKGTE